MDVAENSKSFVERKEIKQRNFAKSETKHCIRSPDKNAEHVIFQIRDENTSIHGESSNAGNHCMSTEKVKPRVRCINDIKSVIEFSVNELKQLVEEKRWHSLVNNIVKKGKKRINV